MLSEEVIDKVVDRLVARIEEANTFVLGQIAESVKKVGTLSKSQLQTIGQIMEFGGDFDKIVKKLAEVTNINEKEIYEIFEEVAKSDYRYAKQFYEYRNIKYIPYEQNTLLKNQVDAIAEITAKEYRNISRTRALGFGIVDDDTGLVTFRGLQEEYQNIIDEAILNIIQGKESFDSAMYKRLNKIGESGLKVVYRNEETGTTYAKRLDSAVRQNIKEGLTKMHIEMQEQIGKQFDSDGVEISVHLAPAPDHEDVQGKQFSTDEFKKFQNGSTATDVRGKKYYPVHNNRIRRAIGQYNCYHYTFNIVLGVSQPAYTDEQLQEIVDKNQEGFTFEGKHYTLYEGTQIQRKLETEIRKAKDKQIMGRKANKPELVNKSQEKINILTNKYKEFSEAGDLTMKLERARVSGYRKVKVKSSTPEIQKPKPAIKNVSIKDNEVFVSAAESKMLDEHFINYYEKVKESSGYLRPFETDKYEKLLQRRKEGYKDETITLNSIENCNNLLNKINTEIQGEEIQNTDFRLVQEATKTVYEYSKKSPATMQELQKNKATLIAKPDTQGVANTLYDRITLNNKYFGDYKKFKEMSINNTEPHTYADAKKHSWWSETAKGNETKEIIAHEFGHRLQSNIYQRAIFKGEGTKVYDYFLDKYGYERYSPFLDETIKSLPTDKYKTIKRDLIYEPIRRLQKKTGLTQKEIIDKYVSRYGRSSYEEMFAETFANSQLGKSNPLGDELIKFLKELGEWEE